jgi:predicted transcriptional regulator
MKKGSGFFKVPNGFTDNVLKGLSYKAVKVYIVLARMRNTATKECFPSFETISERSGISVRRVSDAINELVDKGCIRRKKTSGRSNIYTLTTVEKRQECSVDVVQQPVSNLSVTHVDVVPYNNTNNKTLKDDSLTILEAVSIAGLNEMNNDVSSSLVNSDAKQEKLTYMEAKSRYPDGKKWTNAIGNEHWMYGDECFSLRRSKHEVAYA